MKTFQERIKEYDGMIISDKEFDHHHNRLCKERLSLSEKFFEAVWDKPKSFVQSFLFKRHVLSEQELFDEYHSFLYRGISDDLKGELYSHINAIDMMMELSSPDEYSEPLRWSFNQKMHDIFFEALDACTDYKQEVQKGTIKQRKFHNI